MTLGRRLWLLPLASFWLGCGNGTGPPVETPPPEAQIDFGFPGGSLASARQMGRDTFEIALKDDTNATTKLWFSFRVQEAQGRELTFRLLD